MQIYRSRQADQIAFQDGTGKACGCPALAYPVSIAIYGANLCLNSRCRIQFPLAVLCRRDFTIGTMRVKIRSLRVNLPMGIYSGEITMYKNLRLKTLRKMSAALKPSFGKAWLYCAAAGMLALVVAIGRPAKIEGRTAKSKNFNITGYYQLGFGNTLAILDEHGNLEGHYDVFQVQEVPKPVLTYNISTGSLVRNHMEFKTDEVYGKHYRFSGTVERGTGKDPGDYDYFQLAGNLVTVTRDSTTGKMKVEKHHIVFKSLSQDQSGS